MPCSMFSISICRSSRSTLCPECTDSPDTESESADLPSAQVGPVTWLVDLPVELCNGARECHTELGVSQRRADGGGASARLRPRTAGW